MFFSKQNFKKILKKIKKIQTNKQTTQLILGTAYPIVKIEEVNELNGVLKV